ncbi:site-specific integrase [Pseudodesulfovibrio indicus]|uniref:tyrosine-type recombinase/integrase n=1 Tax=Pseudodesulfovibrio indicus TaxID=1716143 RepID=UPI00292E421F|nr:site-specific integrase [Pseudodesulfovibrio indicus]
MGKATGQKRLVNGKRWPGVYYYESQVKRYGGKPDVCYHIAYRLDGKLKWEKVGWKSEKYTPQIAADIRSDRLKKARHGEEVKTHKELREENRKANIELGEVAAEYFKIRGEASKGAKIDKGRYDNHVAPVLKSRPVKKLGPLDMERIKKKMEGMSAASIWGGLEITRRIINFGVKNGLCEPLGFTIQMPKRDNEVVEYLTPAQLKRFLKALDEWPAKDVCRMLQLAMFTGMRRGEIFKLENRDVDFQQALITLRSPKGGKTVSIPMNGKAEEVLANQIQWRNKRFPESPYIFPGKGGVLRTGCTAVNRIKMEAKLPKDFRIFHGLRHHFAVTLANSGEFSLDMIGELLTHKDASMTKRYGQFLPDTKKQASDRAAELLMGIKVKNKRKVSGE